MVSGIVGSNTHRKLNPNEFRGFALSDVYAPAIFINGADTKAAQIFTLAHELVHLWAGESALNDASIINTSNKRMEQWCNDVAAEFLVPLKQLKEEFNQQTNFEEEVNRIARAFRVSTLVILRRVYDLGVINRSEFNEYFALELARLKSIMEKRKEKGSGGDFYNTLATRNGKRFSRALINTALEGRESFTLAFRLLNIKKTAHFDEFAKRIGVKI